VRSFLTLIWLLSRTPADGRILFFSFPKQERGRRRREGSVGGSQVPLYPL
jgi:hypothetical protein